MNIDNTYSFEIDQELKNYISEMAMTGKVPQSWSAFVNHIEALHKSKDELLQQNKELREALETLLQNGFQVDFAFGEHLRDLVKHPNK